MLKNLICIDRDGTLIYDKKYHLGHTNDWKKKIKILPKVLSGLKLLNKLPDARLYFITNQPGVAIKEFKLLTNERAHKVAHYVVDLFKKKGAKFNGYFICPHANPAYVKKRSKWNFHKGLVCNCSCIKPDLGMVYDALNKEGLSLTNTRVFVVGDRISDIQTALNIGGIGVFVPFSNEIAELDKVKAKFSKHKNVYIAKDFLDAALYIKKKVKK